MSDPNTLVRVTEQYQVAATIHDQIGHQARVMLGVKGSRILTEGLGGILFRIGRNSKGVNLVKVTLNGSDLYDLEFGRVWGANYIIKSEAENVHVASLHDTIEQHTGMYTRL